MASPNQARVYLNQAGTSWPKPEPVRVAMADALASDPASWPQRFEEAHRSIATAFGVRDPERLLLTPGCTSALAVAVADHPWTAGDRVIVSGLEHHALQRPAQKLAAHGVEVVVARRSAEEPVVLEELEAELRRGGTRLVAMTAASNVTGELLPIESIIRLAHEHDALCLIDAAQIAGWLPIDVVALGVDLLAFAGHKGPQAPWGIGGLYVAPHVATTTPAAACALPMDESAPACATMPGYCDVGSVDYVALAGLSAGLAWLGGTEQADRLDRLDRARALVARLRNELADVAGVAFHGPAGPETRVPTLALTVEGRAPSELAAALAGRGVVASGGLQCAPLAHATLGTAPHGVLRFSVGPSNDAGDVERAVAALHAAVS